MSDMSHNHQKKIAVINDMSGFGRCSIAVELPVISAIEKPAPNSTPLIVHCQRRFFPITRVLKASFLMIIQIKWKTICRSG